MGKSDKSLHIVLLYCLTQLGVIYFVYPEDIIASAEEGHWLPVVLGIFVNLIVTAAYMKGLRYFPKQDLIGILTGVGKTAAVLFLLPITVYLFMVNLITVRAFAEIITIVFLSNTPLWSIIALLLAISGLIAMNGAFSIMRTGVLLGLLFLPLMAFVIFMSFQNADWRYVFPLLDDNLGFLTHKSYLESLFAFATSFLFLGFVQPEFKYSPKKVLLGIVALIPFYLLAVYIPLLTFGRATASTFKFPFVMVVSTIQINWLMFDRVTMFLLLSLISFTMLFIALLIWQTGVIVGRTIPKVKMSYIVTALSVVTFIGCVMVRNWEDIEELFLCNAVLRLYVWLIVPFAVYLLGLREKRRSGYGNR
ncbi:GerAB/ArcD/ProY family transporter [Paenibacillus arenilitoris]|uniref:GerAB/ArcD/ProY family transporter n=1 Tax=Paenibacillus arenilitoris TaxID=2772299 RepID=A0A927CQG4_9BACL|nr:GerAB/ArcD/ProY family transporter [Paenibacillus arenilitoris]MBD2872279.1 GerAB/ArcD/ProY family transporter [Paenibacillus arenilitoris]